MATTPRIDDLERRVQKDPASIAFAQLGEEYRRAERYAEAVATCRAGLTIHSGYLSARVTLGRALAALDDLDGAEREYRDVLAKAPENLAAVRGLAEVHHRRGELSEALQWYRTAVGLARFDLGLQDLVASLSEIVEHEQAAAEASEEPEGEAGDAPDMVWTHPALPQLEHFLQVIHSYRQRQAV